MNIVAVDDEQLALDYIKALLIRDNPNHHIQCFSSATEALQFLKDKDNATETVFLDMEMPDMQGLKLAEEISAINSEIDIVFVTGHREFAVEAFELGVKDYLIKPMNFERLTKALSRVKERQDNLPEPALESSEHKLHILLKNGISITDQSGTNNEIRWRTGKAKEVFLYLLHYQKRTVSKAEILEVFWTDYPIEKAFSQLYTIIYHIRKTLQPYKDHLHLMNMDEGYRLVTSNVTIDVLEWKQILRNSGDTITKDLANHLQQTLNSYEGDYLTYSNFLWPEEERTQQQALWRDKSIKLAAYFETNNSLEDAVQLYQKVLHRHPLDEDIHLLLMKLYAKNKQTGSVNDQFQKLLSTLKDELGVSPDPGIIKWYEQWLNRQS
ncbi:response regulator [Salisediminibacterium selenitireducens]|uniref:Response regulator receiver and SARP domain protein n=1 Tax=Bacillus selenitireducens (strain ATCC 700615 / DSM 15326 / MLS10) TaxID=439292 RepID=D6XZN3_BACIE|nr:response regulator [Salisediminibacterium selenitireducens]ADH98407.1 response regulator receiver and SARP domain protein [[Bacillus] selenitireducens MLS10]